MIKFFLEHKHKDLAWKTLLTLFVISLVVVLTIGSVYGGIALFKTHNQNKTNWLLRETIYHFSNFI